MSKYNLTDLYEEMSNPDFENSKEEERLKNHPDRKNIEKIRSMMNKEKEMSENDQSVNQNVSDRIEGMLNIPMKEKFLEIGKELIKDLLVDDPFDIEDVVSHLAKELQKHVRELEEGKTRPGYREDGTPKSNDEMDGDELEDFYQDLDSVDEDKPLKEHFARFLKDYQ